MRHVVIQGASRGLGAALVDACLDRGDRVLATCRDPADLAGRVAAHPRLDGVRLDLTDEGSIREAAAHAGDTLGRVHLLINVAGVLHGPDFGPERKLEELDPEVMQRVFAVNAYGPALVAKHFWRLLKHEEPAVLANVSARVGSIGDNRKGGWYGYRAAKAALNQLLHTAAIELQRNRPDAFCVTLHPGTVATPLSAPFTGSGHNPVTAEFAAARLLGVIDNLRAADNGCMLDHTGQPLPW